jgi:hypothetical protein
MDSAPAGERRITRCIFFVGLRISTHQVKAKTKSSKYDHIMMVLLVPANLFWHLLLLMYGRGNEGSRCLLTPTVQFSSFRRVRGEGVRPKDATAVPGGCRPVVILPALESTSEPRSVPGPRSCARPIEACQYTAGDALIRWRRVSVILVSGRTTDGWRPPHFEICRHQWLHSLDADAHGARDGDPAGVSVPNRVDPMSAFGELTWILSR